MEQKKLEARIAPVLEDILDNFYNEEDLQRVDFKSILLSIAVSVIANYTSQAIDTCYEIFKEKVLPILTEENRIPVDKEREQELFRATFSIFETEINKTSLKDSGSPKH